MTRTIDQLFENAQLTTGQVAEMTGLDPQRVEAIYWGRWLPSPSERERIARVLQVGVDEVDWGHTMSPRVIRYHRFGISEEF
jgi:hypothetical protein